MYLATLVWIIFVVWSKSAGENFLADDFAAGKSPEQPAQAQGIFIQNGATADHENISQTFNVCFCPKRVRNFNQHLTFPLPGESCPSIFGIFEGWQPTSWPRFLGSTWAYFLAGCSSSLSAASTDIARDDRFQLWAGILTSQITNFRWNFSSF